MGQASRGGQPEHLEYFFCHDETDPDLVCVFQFYSSRSSADRFMEGEWYDSYLNEIAEVVDAPPQIQHADLIWRKLSRE